MIVDPDRAVYLEEINSLVIADLHLGYERELEQRGIMVPPQTGKMEERVRNLMEKYGVGRLIILGDLKHEILTTPSELRDFLKDADFQIVLVKGNHDGGIEEFVDFNVYPSSGLRIGRYGFFHGHSWPSKEVMLADIVFMGHLHPEVSLPGSTGKMHRMPCILRSKLSEEGERIYQRRATVYILPSFNPLVGSSIGLPIGPIMKVLEDPEVYLLNGTFLGRYSELQTLDSYQ